MTEEEYVESRGGIDSANCTGCGRSMVIYCDDPRTASEMLCATCVREMKEEASHYVNDNRNTRKAHCA